MCDTFTVFYAFLEIILLVCELSAWSFMGKKILIGVHFVYIWVLYLSERETC